MIKQLITLMEFSKKGYSLFTTIVKMTASPKLPKHIHASLGDNLNA
jgi:hypothetical protein